MTSKCICFSNNVCETICRAITRDVHYAQPNIWAYSVIKLKTSVTININNSYQHTRARRNGTMHIRGPLRLDYFNLSFSEPIVAKESLSLDISIQERREENNYCFQNTEHYQHRSLGVSVVPLKV